MGKNRLNRKRRTRLKNGGEDPGHSKVFRWKRNYGYSMIVTVIILFYCLVTGHGTASLWKKMKVRRSRPMGIIGCFGQGKGRDWTTESRLVDLLFYMDHNVNCYTCQWLQCINFFGQSVSACKSRIARWLFLFGLAQFRLCLYLRKKT